MKSILSHTPFRLLFGLTIAWHASADLPVIQLNTVFPPGAKQGATVEVTVSGGDLEDLSALYFDHAGLKAEPVTEEKDGKQVPVANKFRITVDASTPVGVYDVRAIGRFGISNPPFRVGQFEEVLEVEPNNDTSQSTRLTLPEGQLAVTVSGQINGATDVDYFVVAAKQGQRFLVRCEAQQIDSRLNARMRLMDSNGRILATNDDYDGRDSFLDVTIPEDGDYHVWITDQVFDGSIEYFYRLTMGTMPHIDFVLPPAGQPGTKGAYTLYGRNLPGGVAADQVVVQGVTLETIQQEIEVPAEGLEDLVVRGGQLVQSRRSTVDGFDYQLAVNGVLSNPVRIGLTSLPQVAATEPNNTPEQAQKIAVPCEVFGQFQKARDLDWFAFDAPQGKSWIIEVFCERSGVRVDPWILLRRAKDGAEIGNNDDYNNAPPGLRFDLRTDDSLYQTPALNEGEHQILVRNQFGDTKGDPRWVYRLRVRESKPDFQVIVMHNGPVANNAVEPQNSLLVRQGGNQHLDVYVIRQDGFQDPVTVMVEGLPAGVTCQPTVVGPGQTYAPLVLSAEPTADAVEVEIRVIAKSTIGSEEVTRHGRPASVVWSFNPQLQMPADARLNRSLTLAVREGAPYRVKTPDAVEISRGIPLDVKVEVERFGDFKGAVNGITAANLPPNAKNASINVDANKSEGILKINMPTNVPNGTYTIALRTNTPVPYNKDPKGKKANVNVTDISTPIQLTVTDPVAVEFSPVELKRAGQIELSVVVSRKGQFDGPVTLSLIGLPGEVKANQVTVEKDKTEAKLTINATEKAAIGEVAGAKLRASTNAGGTINLDLPVSLKVVE